MLTLRGVIVSLAIKTLYACIALKIDMFYFMHYSNNIFITYSFSLSIIKSINSIKFAYYVKFLVSRTVDSLEYPRKEI
jgi:hypothetical protein